MKTMTNTLLCALFLAGFAACTDDFATPEERASYFSISVIDNEVKPDSDPTAGDPTSVISSETKPNEDPNAAGGDSIIRGDVKEEQGDEFDDLLYWEDDVFYWGEGCYGG